MTRRHLGLIGYLAFAGGCGPGSDGPPPSEVAEPEGVYGQAPAAVGGIPSVISLQASSGGSPVGDPAVMESPVMDQLGLQFSPRRMLVEAGGTVVFTNSESLTHNIHLVEVDSDSTVFNVDTDTGGRAEFTFEQPGGYHVLCDIHPGMTAFIYVTSSPHTVVAQDDGSFLLTDVPPGAYTITIWSSEPDQRRELPLQVGPGGTRVELDPPG